MKVLVLYDAWEGTEEYPGAEADAAAALLGKRRKRRRPKLDREEIFDALTKLGHEPSYHVLDGTTSSLVALTKLSTDLVFNLTESWAGDDTKDMNLAAYLELLGLRYTGSGPHALHLALDKVLSKKVLRFHEIETPFSVVCYRGKLDHAHDIRFPVIVKPSSEDGSIGIDQASFCSSIKEMMERIEFIQEEHDSPALIEEYIEGREIYAAVLGNGKPEALPLVELDLSQLPDGIPKIAAWEVKFQRDSESFRKTKSVLPSDLPAALTERIQQVAVSVHQILRLRDYARIDLRLTPEGKIYVIEANPNPWLSSKAEFAMAARESGRTYTKLIADIVEVATAR